MLGRDTLRARGLRGATALLLSILVACTGGTDAPSTISPNETSSGRQRPDEKWLAAACSIPPALFERMERDYFPGRSPDLIALPDEPNYFGGFIGTSHSGPWDYVQRVPIVLYGPGFVSAQGETDPEREVTLADIAPTLAELLEVEWPTDRPGRAITEALLPSSERAVPKLVLVVVWDGGGSNVLERWPGAWPNLRRLARGGTYVPNAMVGAAPSNTPVAHSNIGTGAWPDQHGIVDIKMRAGNEIVDPFLNQPPKYLELTTIADIYDAAVGNRAEIGLFGYHAWHLGMLGHGSFTEGGDRDLVALVGHRGDEIIGLPDHYEFPSYAASVPGLDEDARAVDVADGTMDSLWLGRDFMSDSLSLKQSPAYILYQTRIVREMLERDGFGTDEIADLFFVNYKPLDVIGHEFNMTGPEVQSGVRYSDGELAKLEDILDATAGEGEWVMIVTADHGQTPAALTTGAWPIKMDEVVKDIAAHFEVKTARLIQDGRVGNFFLNRRLMDRKGLTLEAMADFLTDYRLNDNLFEGLDLPEEYEDRLDERLFAAAWPPMHTERISECIQAD